MCGGLDPAIQVWTLGLPTHIGAWAGLERHTVANTVPSCHTSVVTSGLDAAIRLLGNKTGRPVQLLRLLGLCPYITAHRVCAMFIHAEKQLTAEQQAKQDKQKALARSASRLRHEDFYRQVEGYAA